MARGRTVRTMATRYRDGEGRRGPDALIVEEPMEIRLDGHLVTTTMRTPGHDFELAVGFCHSEGLLDGASVEAIRYCGTGSAVDTEFNVVSVSTGGRAPVPTARVGTTSSSCGLCGSTTIDTLTDRLMPLAANEAVRQAHAAMRAAVTPSGNTSGCAAPDRQLCAGNGGGHHHAGRQVTRQCDRGPFSSHSFCSMAHRPFGKAIASSASVSCLQSGRLESPPGIGRSA